MAFNIIYECSNLSIILSYSVMTKTRQKASKRRSVNFVLPTDLIDHLDELAAENYESRTGVIVRLIVNEMKRRELPESNRNKEHPS